MWKADIWLDPNETDHLKAPGHSDSPLPGEEACLPGSEETSLPQRESPVTTDTLKGEAHSL